MKPSLKTATAALLLTGFFAFSGCGERSGETTDGGDSLGVVDTSTTMAPMSASAQLQGGSGSNIAGNLQFQMQGDSTLQVTGTVTGLPDGQHGIHIHQNGSCEAADTPDDPDTDPNPFGAAGPHWAGLSTNHGAPTDALDARHAGDMGNIDVANGQATVNISLASNMPMDSLVGKAVVIHEKQDDLKTQPSGASGARIACGVIQEGGGTDMSADTTGSPTASR